MHVRAALHGHQKRQVIDMMAEMGQQIAHPPAALAMLPQSHGRLEHRAWCARRRFDANPCPGIEWLAVQPLKSRLVIEQVHLARAAIHEELYHPPRPWPMTRTNWSFPRMRKHIRQRHGAKPTAQCLQKLTS
jgi:hypothetical protein